MIRGIVLHSNDNVATLIDTGEAGGSCKLQGEKAGQVKLAAALPFGHKVAIAAIKKGGPVIKYGQVIGNVTADVAIGEHVHVHNVESQRGRGDRAKKE
ncbi:MAG: D-galactarate dehydratase [Alphaproteobacteria bacterium]|nr:D-galactarate dehydratase [Alphaproteobacteria bacterium]